MMLPGLQHRDRRPELMDAPDLAPGEHDASLRGLARINFLSRSAAVYWRALRPLHGCPLRILDLACGGGDVLLSLWRRAQQAGWPLTCVGADRSATALARARRQAEAAGAKLEFVQLDVIQDDWPGAFDAVSCSLFLHHLDDADVVRLLERMAAAARRMILANDLRRSRTGLLLAKLAPRLLTRSRIVHVDAVRSVRAALTPSELRALALQAGLGTARIECCWPQRMLLTWSRA